MTRDQGVQLIAEVAGLRKAVEDLVGLLTPGPASSACPHPIDMRIDESGMGQAPYTVFLCSACGDRITA